MRIKKIVNEPDEKVWGVYWRHKLRAIIIRTPNKLGFGVELM